MHLDDLGLYGHLAGRCIIKRKSNGKAKVIVALESRWKKKRGQQVCCEFGVPLTHIFADLDLLYLHCAQEQSRQLTLITEQHSPDIMRRRPQPLLHYC